MNASANSLSAVDLFCGVGGLTYGLETAGVSVTLGVDIDEGCRYALESNSRARFLRKDISDLTAGEVQQAFQPNSIRVLAGCAPCQPFSTYSRSAKTRHGNEAGEGRSSDWRLLLEFGRLISEVEPEIVTMENVPPLSDQQVFQDFLKGLRGYFVEWRVVECDRIGLPQTRKRLVLLASRLGPIAVPEFNFPRKTVRQAIGSLPSISAGGVDADDALHRSSRLSVKNTERIRASKQGGTWRDWPDHLRADCHAKSTGATYPSVYGRMSWDKPSPTITTQCFGYGNGRFGHPEQDRAISLREAAMLQGFPRHYAFLREGEPVSFSKIGRMIGNAVPVNLGKVIGEIIIEHVSAAALQSSDNASRAGFK